TFAWLNSRCGLSVVVDRLNEKLTAASGHAAPSLVNGSDVQLDDSGTRASITGALRNRVVNLIARGASRLNTPFSKCPTNPRLTLTCGSIHEMYGTLPKNVMSGLTESRWMSETGLPPLNSSK